MNSDNNANAADRLVNFADAQNIVVFGNITSNTANFKNMNITNSGLTLPTYTQTERDALNVAIGTVVFNSTTQSVNVFDNTMAWTEVGGASQQPSVPLGDLTDAETTNTSTIVLDIDAINDTLFLGENAGTQNTATGNTFIGNQAGASNTAGFNNTFVGPNTGSANTTGANNTFVGSNAGSANTTGADNTFVGQIAGTANTAGNQNTFFGPSAGTKNTTGSDNVFIGAFAGAENLTGSDNVYIGRSTGIGGDLDTTGARNTFVGRNAGANITTGVDNTFIGRSAGSQNQTGSENVALGENCGTLMQGNNQNVFIGVDAVTNGLEVGTANVIIGYKAGESHAIGSNCTILGYRAGQANNGDDNVFIGYFTGNAIIGGTDNTFIGSTAGGSGVNPNQNTLIGRGASQNIEGDNNVCIGYQSGSVITTGSGNTCIGQISNVNSGLAIDRIAIGRAVIAATDSALFTRIRNEGASTANVRYDNLTQELFEVTSSQRFKTDIRDYKHDAEASAAFYRLRPRTFKAVDDVSGWTYPGFIAEEVAEVFPMFTTYDDEQQTIPRSVMYDRLMLPIFCEINNLFHEVEVLKHETSNIIIL